MSDQTGLLEKAFTIALSIERPAGRCQALCGIGETWLTHGNKALGLETIAEALKAADLLKHPDEKAKHLAWLGRLLKEAGEEAKAVEQFKRAYYLARAAESVAQKVSAFYYLASEYVDAGLIAEAKAILAELEPLAIDPRSEVDSVCELINIAEIYADIDDPDKAEAALVSAAQAARALKDPWFQAERLTELAEIANGSGHKEEAASLILEALSDMDKIEETSRSYFWLKVAAVYVDLEMKTQAAECLLKAREAILKSEDLNAAAGDVRALAEGYLNLGDLPTTLTLLEKSQTIINDLKDDQDRISRLLETAELYTRLGESVKAREAAERVYKLSAAVADNKAKLFILGKLAVLYRTFNNQEQPVKLVDEICFIVAETKAKTSGLGAIAEELVAGGESVLALKLAEIIREPEVKAGVLIAIARNQER